MSDLDFDLLELITEKAPTSINNGKTSVDPLFQDAYDDFTTASTATDRAEAFRLMIKLCKTE